jgi:hypothetical protein
LPWFKIDDGFWSHPKTLQLSDGAQALWMRAGSWSMHQLTDGFIPNFALPILSAKPRYVDELRTVSLWFSVEDGNQFHDWMKYQPTREQVEADRLAAADRKRKSREKSQQPSRVTDARVTGGDTPTPTRPDPTRPIKEHKALVQPAVELAREFEMFWEVFPRKQAKAPAAKAFKTARKKVDMKILMRGVQAYALLNIGQDKSLIKLPAGWLNDERWADEQIANATRQMVISKEKFCEIHPDYPVTARYPCEACSRNVGLDDGREF